MSALDERFGLLSNDCLVENVVHYLARLMRGYRFHNSSGHLFLHYLIVVLQLPHSLQLPDCTVQSSH